MKCQNCKRDFKEKEIHTSHNIPCYLFYTLKNRKEKKYFADKLGRHYLCEDCHKNYESSLNFVLRKKAKDFANRWFKNG